MSLDDDRFPPVTPQNIADQTPLDLSVLARVATETIEEPPKPRDKPPRPRTSQPRANQTRQDSPPRSRARASNTPPVADSDDVETPTYRPGILVKPLRDMYVTVGTLVIPFNKPVGTSFIQNAENCARALDNAAKADKQIRRVLMLLVQGSVWGEVIIAHMPIMMALAVTMVPSVRSTMNGVQSEGGETETVNPVSNGYGR
jgi:hypothetical protein